MDCLEIPGNMINVSSSVVVRFVVGVIDSMAKVGIAEVLVRIVAGFGSSIPNDG